MKIGAGGLQSQIIEEAVRVRQVDPSRNRPDQEDQFGVDRKEGQEGLRELNLNRPVEQNAKNAEVSNHIGARMQDENAQDKQPDKADSSRNNYQKAQYIDVYV